MSLENLDPDIFAFFSARVTKPILPVEEKNRISLSLNGCNCKVCAGKGRTTLGKLCTCPFGEKLRDLKYGPEDAIFEQDFVTIDDLVSLDEDELIELFPRFHHLADNTFVDSEDDHFDIRTIANVLCVGKYLDSLHSKGRQSISRILQVCCNFENWSQGGHQLQVTSKFLHRHEGGNQKLPMLLVDFLCTRYRPYSAIEDLKDYVSSRSQGSAKSAFEVYASYNNLSAWSKLSYQSNNISRKMQAATAVNSAILRDRMYNKDNRDALFWSAFNDFSLAFFLQNLAGAEFAEVDDCLFCYTNTLTRCNSVSEGAGNFARQNCVNENEKDNCTKDLLCACEADPVGDDPSRSGMGNASSCAFCADCLFLFRALEPEQKKVCREIAKIERVSFPLDLDPISEDVGDGMRDQFRRKRDGFTRVEIGKKSDEDDADAEMKCGGNSFVRQIRIDVSNASHTEKKPWGSASGPLWGSKEDGCKRSPVLEQSALEGTRLAEYICVPLSSFKKNEVGCIGHSGGYEFSVGGKQKEEVALCVDPECTHDKCKWFTAFSSTRCKWKAQKRRICECFTPPSFERCANVFHCERCDTAYAKHDVCYLESEGGFQGVFGKALPYIANFLPYVGSGYPFISSIQPSILANVQKWYRDDMYSIKCITNFRLPDMINVSKHFQQTTLYCMWHQICNESRQYHFANEKHLQDLWNSTGHSGTLPIAPWPNRQDTLTDVVGDPCRTILKDFQIPEVIIRLCGKIAKSSFWCCETCIAIADAEISVAAANGTALKHDHQHFRHDCAKCMLLWEGLSSFECHPIQVNSKILLPDPIGMEIPTTVVRTRSLTSPCMPFVPCEECASRISEKPQPGKPPLSILTDCDQCKAIRNSASFHFGADLSRTGLVSVVDFRGVSLRCVPGYKELSCGERIDLPRDYRQPTWISTQRKRPFDEKYVEAKRARVPRALGDQPQQGDQEVPVRHKPGIELQRLWLAVCSSSFPRRYTTIFSDLFASAHVTAYDVYAKTPSSGYRNFCHFYDSLLQVRANITNILVDMAKRGRLRREVAEELGRHPDDVHPGLSKGVAFTKYWTSRVVIKRGMIPAEAKTHREGHSNSHERKTDGTCRAARLGMSHKRLCTCQKRVSRVTITIAKLVMKFLGLPESFPGLSKFARSIGIITGTQMAWDNLSYSLPRCLRSLPPRAIFGETCVLRNMRDNCQMGHRATDRFIFLTSRAFATISTTTEEEEPRPPLWNFCGNVRLGLASQLVQPFAENNGEYVYKASFWQLKNSPNGWEWIHEAKAQAKRRSPKVTSGIPKMLYSDNEGEMCGHILTHYNDIRKLNVDSNFNYRADRSELLKKYIKSFIMILHEDRRKDPETFKFEGMPEECKGVFLLAMKRFCDAHKGWVPEDKRQTPTSEEYFLTVRAALKDPRHE